MSDSGSGSDSDTDPLDFIDDFWLKIEVRHKLADDNLTGFSIIQGNGHAIRYRGHVCMAYVYPDQDIDYQHYFSVCKSDPYYPDEYSDQLGSFKTYQRAHEYTLELMGRIIGPSESTLRIHECRTVTNEHDEEELETEFRTEFAGVMWDGNEEQDFIEYCADGVNYQHFYDSSFLERNLEEIDF